MPKQKSTLEQNGFFITASAWWSFWIILQWVALQDLGVKPGIAIVDSLVSNGLLSLFCYLVIRNLKYYLPGRERYIYVLVVSASLSGMWLFITKFVLKMFFKADEQFLGALAETSVVRYAFSFLMISCTTMLGLLWYTQKELKEDNERQVATEALAREAELNKLRQQLQPHFLFNSLNSISALTGSQPEKARHMIQQLADFLRGTLKKEGEQWVTFEEELQHLKLYLEIEEVRFGYRLQTRINFLPEHLQMKLPALILQPVVENAIKFGLYDTTGEVEIRIHATTEGEKLIVTVQNPFDENTAMPKQGTGFGLTSIRRRLYLLFGRNDLVEVMNKNNTFTTILKIPQNK